MMAAVQNRIAAGSSLSIRLCIAVDKVLGSSVESSWLALVDVSVPPLGMTKHDLLRLFLKTCTLTTAESSQKEQINVPTFASLAPKLFNPRIRIAISSSVPAVICSSFSTRRTLMIARTWITTLSYRLITLTMKAT
jgi:hypothetical protein